MADERNKTLDVLKTAVQMEIDGKEFYLKASQESRNEMGKKLLQSLAEEEDIHRKKFEQIFDSISSQKGWPGTDFKPDGGSALRTIVAAATESLDKNARAIPTELDAIQTAIDMEGKTYDFYNKQLESAVYDAEKSFYQALTSQEREHQLVLLDYYEYLKDPAAWFVKEEHPSLDGG